MCAGCRQSLNGEVSRYKFDAVSHIRSIAVHCENITIFSKLAVTVVLLVHVCVLAERARPYLLTTDAHASTDYINAVYIDVRINLLACDVVALRVERRTSH